MSKQEQNASRPGGELWGILGGVGPLASAEFLATIYEAAAQSEQHLPRVVLLSDPSIPDRTEALLNGRESELAEAVALRAEQLMAAGATRLIFCCVTMHAVAPQLPAAVRSRLVSLVDLALDTVELSSRSHLLLCTEGTRNTQLFQRDQRWSSLCDRIALLDDRDQRAVHEMIYQIKRHEETSAQIELVEYLMRGYGVDSYIAGCTEMHILAKRHGRLRQVDRNSFCLDPLTIAASMICGHEQTLVQVA